MLLTKKNIDPGALRDSGTQSQRWLSLPESRLVINPYPFGGLANDVTHASYSDGPDMPLNLGYLDPKTATDSGVWMDDALLMQEGSASGGTEQLWQADLSDKSVWYKTAPNTGATCKDGVLTIRVPAGAPEPWQYVAQRASIDLSSSPLLTITVDSAATNWALKICPDGQADISIQGDTNKTGTFTYDISKLTGLTGSFNGLIKVFAIGLEKDVCVSRLDISVVSGTRQEAASFTTAWTPYALPFTANYPEGLAIDGEDFYADTETVVRTIRATAGGELSLGGKLYGTPVDYTDGLIVVDCGTYSYTIAVSEPLAPYFYRDYLSYVAGESSDDSPDSSHTYYGFDTATLQAGDTLVVTLSLASDTKDADDVAERAVSFATKAAAADALALQIAYWTDYLSRVPQPADFTLDIVDDMDVMPENIERMYYTAWVFMAQNVLPANPEIGFEYRQVACGKPSMWGGGDPLTIYTASWESFFGMMCLGYVMPEVAWDAYIGLMSLVDDEGILAGESLPSEKAHTGYLLYNLTGDADKLAAVYDDIARYLQWRVENPRWIYLDTNNPDSVDADFAESALIDLKYMMEIAAVTGHEADIPMWQETYDALLENYRKWFFDANMKAYQYCSKSTYARSYGNTLWVTKGLYLPELGKTYENSLIRRFREDYDKNSPFGGFALVKYPDVCHTMYGLIDRGYSEIASTFVELCLRDVVRVGMFAENYDGTTAKPTMSGVRPSIFGCAMLIDTVLMSNGFMYETGLLKAVNIGFSGGVCNIHMRGQECSVAVNAETQCAVVIMGDERTAVELEKGKTVTIK